jgi:hypothetical protein
MPVTKPRKLPRAVRLDDSDIEVFAIPAKPGEWAVPGGFEFLDHDCASLSGKPLQAFKSGFLGIGSFGRTTLTAITEASEADFRSAVEQLAVFLVNHHGAPNLAAAMQAADEEVSYAESLCEYEINTLLAVEREFTVEGISERFKRFIPSGSEWDRAKPLVYVKDS